MTRVKRGNVAYKRRKKVLKLAKGFQGSHSKLFRTAKQQIFKSLKYAYIDRRKKKNYYRRLWIIRINAKVRLHNLNYSRFISSIKRLNIAINRKMLAQLAFFDERSFVFILNNIK